MALPRLIHPVQVTFQVFSPAELVMDAEARAPVHGARSAAGVTYVIPCQVSWTKKDEPEAGVGGTNESSSGYFLARAFDMDRILGAGVRLKRGDRVVSYTSLGPTFEVVTVALYISRCDPYGHYPERGASLYKCQVTDRDPVEQ